MIVSFVFIVSILIFFMCFKERSTGTRGGGASSSGANQERAGRGTRGEVWFNGDCFNNTVLMTSIPRKAEIAFM